MIQLGQGSHPIRADLSVHGGDPVNELVTARDALGVAIDFTGWTFSADVLDAAGVHVLGSFSTSAEPGGLAVVATAAQTAAWARTWPLFSPWRINATHPSGDPIFRARGWLALYR